MSFAHQDATDANDYQIVSQGTSPWIVSPLSGGGELATFVVNATSVAIGNGKSMLSIVNASGSTVVLKLRELYITNVQNTAVTGVISEFQLKRIVGHSAGTALTPASYDTNDALSGSITARTGATVTTEGTDIFRRVTWSSDEWGVGAQDVESEDHEAQLRYNIVQQFPGCKPFTLRANQGLTVKQITNSTVGKFDVVAVFTQENG